MIKGLFGAIENALEAVWEHEVFGPIIRVALWALAVICMFVLVTITLTGWAYTILLIFHG